MKYLGELKVEKNHTCTQRHTHTLGLEDEEFPGRLWYRIGVIICHEFHHP